VAFGEIYQFERMWPTLEQPWYFTDPYDVAVDRNGYVYISDEMNSQIQKFTADGQFVSKWGREGEGDKPGPGEFNSPRGIDVDNDNFVYVADSQNHRIQKFTSDGNFVSEWGAEGSEDGNFDRPYGVATDTIGYIYVADTYNNRIQKFTADGQFITKWGISGSGDKEFKLPYSIAVDSKSGYVYVADTKKSPHQEIYRKRRILRMGNRKQRRRIPRS